MTEIMVDADLEAEINCLSGETNDKKGKENLSKSKKTLNFAPANSAKNKFSVPLSGK